MLSYEFSSLGIKHTVHLVDVYDTFMLLLHVTVWKRAINTLSEILLPFICPFKILLSTVGYCELLVIGKFGSGAMT